MPLATVGAEIPLWLFHCPSQTPSLAPYYPQHRVQRTNFFHMQGDRGTFSPAPGRHLCPWISATFSGLLALAHTALLALNVFVLAKSHLALKAEGSSPPTSLPYSSSCKWPLLFPHSCVTGIVCSKPHHQPSMLRPSRDTSMLTFLCFHCFPLCLRSLPSSPLCSLYSFQYQLWGHILRNSPWPPLSTFILI